MKKTREIKLLFTLDFDEDMKFSLNRVWSGGNGSQWVRKSKRELWHETIEMMADDGEIKPIKDIPERIQINYIFYFKSRALDTTNCSVMSKLIEDSLVESNIIGGDSNKFVLFTGIEVKDLPKNLRKEMEEDIVLVEIKEFIEQEDSLYPIKESSLNLPKK